MKDGEFKVPQPRDGTNRTGMSSGPLLPTRNTTILTNLQRGNVRTEIAPLPLSERSFYELAAQGELFRHVLETQMSHLLNIQDENGLTGLMWASTYGQLATVRLLLEFGANPHLKGKHGESALLLAAANGHLHVLKVLMSVGCELNDTDEDGNSALMYTAHGDHALCMNELLKANADFTLENMNQDTAYSIATKQNSSQAKQMLEKHMLRLVE